MTSAFLNTLKNSWKILPIGSLDNYQNRLSAGEKPNQFKTLAHELYAIFGTAYLLGALAYGPIDTLAFRGKDNRDNLENKIVQVQEAEK
mgnify:CR=1 FL=1